jgi:hypothetical protein
LDVAFYKDPACTQAFSGSDTVGPDTVIYSKFSLGGNNDNDDPVDAVGYITGTLTFTGYTGQRPQVRINAEYFDGKGGYWVEDWGGSYTVNADGSFSIPFVQQFLTALNAGTLDLRFQLYIGSGNSQFSKRIEPMIQVTASQLSNGNLNVGSLGTVSLASITLSGTISVTINGQPVPRVHISTSGGYNNGSTTLTSPGTNAAWSITFPASNSPANLTFYVYGYDSQGNRLFYRSEAASVSGVSNTNVSGVVINLGNITTTTLSGTVDVTIGGQKPYMVEIFTYTNQNNAWSSQIGDLYINNYASKPNTFSMTIETPDPGTTVYFRIDTRMSNSGDWGGYKVLSETVTIPSSGAIPPVALSYHGSGN